ncbi:tRNA pseudouridine(38-40) synthase TruA [Pinibacter soli]|uniref:tRNA pseudouridine synthase A n=1 Tax=Pinibacter soli TaxID=3044211 RepID=A0ABT6R6T7_9BACT|nr:tRNA pseudouridine(38-40) synthase TruA [Pinibacter soli]MDI3318265.1 tRNA pseudouridine(38-40) synthase TruA [Pinibacter soli]
MRYFIEVAYNGAAYSGFQIQENAHSVQAEVEKAFGIIHRKPVALTGSSRTDAGVHALQNFFHFDYDDEINPRAVYKINAILPADLVVKNIYSMPQEAHSRFDALSREYKYFIYGEKNPFLHDRAYYFPYTLDIDQLKLAAQVLKEYTDYTSFSKRNTQVKTFNCNISVSEWIEENGCLVYHVKGNRFLRGMVRALTGTMLRVGRGKYSIDDFRKIIEAKDCTQADFSVPPHALFLVNVQYPDGYLHQVESPKFS